tara:strand:- start:445 stop:885 length:441 start_codon:yes stop_codon:yes gene_type:complete
MKKFNIEYYGVDPSTKSVKFCRDNNIKAFTGSADNLDFKSNYFDIVIYGFCLYLCDREDLPKIFNEANRVLKKKSWVIILDFFSHKEISKPYKHFKGITSYKCDYRKMFDVNLFTCYSHKIFDHETFNFTSKANDWISISSFRKNK